MIRQKKPARILIVDDDESIRLGLREILEARGFSIDVASDGVEAGVSAIHNAPSLIILDLKMPGLDGFHACRLIRANPLLRNIKILILTGYPSKSNIDKAFKLGADRCLAKPVSGKILYKEITALLKSRVPRHNDGRER